MGRLEVDLVARRVHLVAFFEVKTRWSGVFGSPLQAVTWGKRREIVRVARAWVDRNSRPDDAYRFDVIGVTISSAGRTRPEQVAEEFRV
ncbi:MAG: YraN family protein [Gemmatimonadales bacterium]|nr:YraN family protein [Gemmatimonadales bacterium]